MKDRYCSYDKISIELDSTTSVFDVKLDGIVRLSGCRLLNCGEMVLFDAVQNDYAPDTNCLKLSFKENEIAVDIGRQGFVITSALSLVLEATVMGEDLIATSMENHKFFRSSYGHASNALDDTMFDRQNDFAITVSGEGKRFIYDFDKSEWHLSSSAANSISVTLTENLYAHLYDVNYSPLNRNTTFKRPPVGWMTWYAVKFDASEKTVLDNSRWLAENLKKYGADSIWVDWEWYHKDMKGERDDGCDTFNPDPEKYPNGLKYVSDEIRKLDLIPCLWMGICTDPGENEFVKEHPDAVILHERRWCGQYFFDFTHPEYLNNFLPRALGQVAEWGYEAVKMDTLPNGFLINETNRLKAYDPTVTSREAFRNMIKKCREILGENRYMLSCSGTTDAVILWPVDYFEAARIGDDIFAWDSFVKQAVARAGRYYPFHNVMFLNDADNVIVREEFNTYEQAKSRTAFVSLLGLPVTLGDDLPKLPEERVDLLRRSIPALDIHSASLKRFVPDDIVPTCLTVNTGEHSYYVVSVFNTSDIQKDASINLSSLGIEYSKPLVFEYYSNAFEKTDEINITLQPFETKVYAVREDKGVPQILSTSRHLTQGILETENIEFKNDTLSFTASLVENDPYRVTLHLPDGYKIKTADGFDAFEENGSTAVLSVKAYENEIRHFSVKFKG